MQNALVKVLNLLIEKVQDRGRMKYREIDPGHGFWYLRGGFCGYI
jgi:hypothetical protein